MTPRRKDGFDPSVNVRSVSSPRGQRVDVMFENAERWMIVAAADAVVGFLALSLFSDSAEALIAAAIAGTCCLVGMQYAVRAVFMEQKVEADRRDHLKDLTGRP